MRLCLPAILFWASPSILFAQNNKDTLREIRVSAPKQHSGIDVKEQFSAGQQKIQFDSTLLNFYRERSLSELIVAQSPVFVKSYGVNNMATLSIRGASAAQSEVLWNGIPVDNAALGIADISLLQAGLFSNIRIQYGGSSALFGSGNVGGALILEDKIPDFQKSCHLSVSAGSGSYGHLDGLVRADWQNKHWHFDVKAFYEHAQNNFLYQNNQGDWEKMPNALLSAAGGIFSADYLFQQKSGSKIQRQTVSLKVWLQQYNREIPPALFESFSVKQQQDKDLHGLIEWQQKRNRSYFYGKLAFSKGSMNYQDGVVLPNNENNTNQWYAELGWKWQINNPALAKKWLHELLVFLPAQWAVVTGDNLNGEEKQWRPAIAAAYRFQSVNGKLTTNFSFRREWWAAHSGSWLPGWNAELRLIQFVNSGNYFSISLLENVQKSYRVPDIDELFFSPGGNPDLRPEQGWNESGGYSAKLKLGKMQDRNQKYTWEISNETSLFNRNIKDWIYWLGGAVWTPHNLAEVHSRGLETETKISWNKNRFQIYLGLKTAYVLATTTASYLPHDNSIGDQIPYTPRYRGIGNIGFSWSGFFVNYNQQYTGYRFITTDESQFLNPYQTGDLQVSYTFPVAHYTFSVMGQIRNLWNRQYEVVNARPMPGRNFLVSMNVALY